MHDVHCEDETETLTNTKPSISIQRSQVEFGVIARRSVIIGGLCCFHKVGEVLLPDCLPRNVSDINSKYASTDVRSRG